MRFGNEYIQINPNLYLTEYSFQTLDPTFDKKKKKKKRECINHIWIYDRSGSMYGLIKDLIKDLTQRAKKIPIGDTITIGWFSSEGQKNFIVKGFKVTEKKDYSILEKALQANNYTLGCTCFSEILDETEQVVKDLSIFSSNFALAFFTDGYPVVSDYTKEIKSIYAAVEKLNDKITSSLLVGYGDYYNKQLMAEMAEKIGGSLTHSANLPSFSISLDSFLETAQDSKKITVKIDAETNSDSIIYSINGNSINLYTIDSNKEIKLSCSEEEKVSVFVLTNNKPKGKEAKKESEFEKALYAASYLLTQRTKTDLAIDILGYLGDKKLIDMVTNSYTNAEYGVAEENIKSATVDQKFRYLDGKVSGYVPPIDAFCFLDLIDLLSTDAEAHFYPRHDSFIYKRIGKPSVPDEKYAKFIGDKNTKSSFSDVVWNETKVNLSMRAYITGTIELPDESRKYGLASPYPTYQWKNYTFIKDGILNVTKVPATVSKDTYDILTKKGVIDPSEAWEKDKILILMLDAIPIVNRKIAKGNTSAKELCELVLEEQRIKASLKALKYFKGCDYPEREVTAETAKTFIEKQQAFLEGIGINTKTGAYEPPVTSGEATDFYMAKEFAIKVKGLSSLPKVEAVADKMNAQKKLTTAELLVGVGVSLYKNENKPSLEWFTTSISNHNTALKKVRRKIQETKFAILLGKASFDEFTSRESNNLLIGGFEFTFSVSEVRVAI